MKNSYLRKSQNLTQKKPTDIVAYYECKAKNPIMFFLNSLIKLFQVPEAYFLEEDTKHKLGPSSLLEDKISKIKQLPFSQQKTVIAILDGVIDNLVRK